MRRYVFHLAILSLAVLAPTAARADEQSPSDQAIAQQIVQKLQAEKQSGGLKGFSIDLQVEDGTVWLSGRVASEQQRDKALDIARRIPGVAQVVNDLDVNAQTATPRSVFAGMTNAVQKAMGRQVAKSDSGLATAGAESPGAIGSGVVHAAQPVAATPNYYQSPDEQQAIPQQYAIQQQATPVYAGSRNQVPLAFAPAQHAAYQAAVAAQAQGGGPVPMHFPGSGVGIAPARYDHPHMPGHAWPSYASYPNYAAVTYPKQYSPTAWPYIGPFYPYPQVPLGWRKVTLEWDDGWWMLDFKDRRTMYNHH